MINSAARCQRLTQNKCTPNFSIQDASPLALPSIVTAEARADYGTPSVVFEPVLPQSETLVGMGVIVILCVVVSWVWANQVVPVSRTKLAIDKSRGEVKEYLDKLKASDPSVNADQAAANIEGASISGNDSTIIETISTPTPAEGNTNRAFERWLFTDWLQDNKSARKAGRQKEPALPILKDAKWNSGDNPVLVASTIIGLGVIVSAVIERALSIS
jgi:hypothetical protein